MGCSDSWLAKDIGCDKNTVSAVRDALEAGGEIHLLDVLTGEDGKQYPRRQIRKPADSVIGAAIREDLESTSQIAKFDVLTGEDGKQYPRRQIRKPADSVIANLRQQNGKASEKAAKAVGSPRARGRQS